MPQLHPLSWFKMFMVFVGFIFFMISVMNCIFSCSIGIGGGSEEELKLYWKW